MPAEQIEIREAEEEGVQFVFLRAPAAVLGADGRVTALRLQRMALGEPDARGRRRPLPVDGAFDDLPVDSVIAAIGQGNDPEGFAELPQTARGTIAADAATFATALTGVFACGDTVNDGAGIAIGAIAQANAAARAIDAFLRGSSERPVTPILSRRTVDARDYAHVPRRARLDTPHRDAAVRRTDFAPVDRPLDDAAVRAEASRCLACGCHDYASCRLIRYANRFGADGSRFTGARHPGGRERRLVSIERDQGKCLLCNLCVRTCDQEVKAGLLGLVGRGFTTRVKPEFRDTAATDACRACHRCVDVCPTGALRLLDGPNVV
jgi:formate dehydrogenase major subunit